MRDVSITSNDLTKTYGDKTPLMAYLRDGNTSLSGKTLRFNIHGVNYDRTTDATGKAVLNINLGPGTYPCTISFLGDASYNPASAMVVVRILSDTIRQAPSKRPENYFEVNKIPLKVLLGDGFQTKMGTDVKETDLLKFEDTLNAPTFFFNSGDHGVEFEISVVIRESYYYNNLPISDYLNTWNKTSVPVSVVTDAMDVPNSKYIMTIKSKKQNRKVQSIWKLRFKQYYENNLSFDTVYSGKTTSLSAQDQLLLKYNLIDKNSPKEVILALQQKLQRYGCWQDIEQVMENGRIVDVIVTIDNEPQFKPRVPSGVWDWQMTRDIYRFQDMMQLSHTDGVVDRETITAMLGDMYEGTSITDRAGYGINKEF